MYYAYIHVHVLFIHFFISFALFPQIPGPDPSLNSPLLHLTLLMSITFTEPIFLREEVSLTFLSGGYLFLHSPGTIGHSGLHCPCHLSVRPLFLRLLPSTESSLCLLSRCYHFIYLPPPHSSGWLPSLTLSALSLSSSHCLESEPLTVPDP